MDLDALLRACLAPDNQLRQQAEQALRSAGKQPAVVPQLLQRLAAAPGPDVRQLAALLLRKCIARHWHHLDDEVQAETKRVLLSGILQEPHHLVRRATADVVSAVAQQTVPFAEWPGLLEFLQQCSASAQAAHREAALLVFTSLTETIGEHLRSHFGALQAMFLAGLCDGSTAVRAAALAAAGALVRLVVEPPEAALFRDLVPAILTVSQQCLASSDEMQAVQSFEILSEFVDCPAPLVGPVLPSMVAFCMQTALNAAYELSTREQALEVVHWVARCKPKQLCKGGRLVRDVVAALCSMCAEAATSDQDDDSQRPAHKFSARLIDGLAMELPSKHVFPDVLAFSKAHARSPDTNQRRAACAALGAIAEGCSEAASRRITDVLRVVVGSLQDPDHAVRIEAALALGHLSRHCNDLEEHHELVLPALLAAIDTAPSPDALHMACFALDIYSELLDDEILPYLEAVMARMLALLQRHDEEAQAAALSVVASAAASAGYLFQPYAATLLPLLGRYMQQTRAGLLRARALATECVGLVAVALGRAFIEPLVPSFMQAALQGLELDDSLLREHSFGMFANVAEVLGPGFGAYLAPTVSAAIHCCQQEELTAPASNGFSHPGAHQRPPQQDVEDSEDDDLDQLDISVRTGVTDEKASALGALAAYAEHCGAAFMPFLEQALPVAEQLVEHWHAEVRGQAHKALGQLLLAAHRAFPPPSSGGVSPQVAHMVGRVLPPLLSSVREDDDKAAVVEALTAAAAAVRQLGAQPLQQHLEPLSDASLLVLLGDAPCQAVHSADDDGEAFEEDDCEADEALLEAAGEVLPALAAALGPPQYVPAFLQQHLPALLQRARASQPECVRAIAVGVVAELSEALGAHSSQHAEAVVPVVVRELRAEGATNRRNAAFCCGCLCRHAPDAMRPHLPALLQALHPLFSADEDPGTRDNAAGAVGRMIQTLAAHLPLAQVLPVLLGALPLQEDLDEAEAVFSALGGLLLQNQSPAVMEASPSIVKALLHVAVSQLEVAEGVRQQAARVLLQVQHLKPHAQHLASLLAGLDEGQTAQLHRTAAL